MRERCQCKGQKEKEDLACSSRGLDSNLQRQGVLSSAPLQVVLVEKENDITGMAAETGGSWTHLLSFRTFSQSSGRMDKGQEGEARGAPKVVGKVSETRWHAVTPTFKR